MQVKEQWLEPYMEQRIDWFKIQKGAWQGCILSLCLFNFYAEYIMQNARLGESQVGIKIAKTKKKDCQEKYLQPQNLRYTEDKWQKLKRKERASWWRS